MSHTEREILSQPDVWQTTIDSLSSVASVQFWDRTQPSSVLATGCGSTFYLALAAAGLLRDEAGVQSRATPASEIALGSAPIVGIESSVLLAISRSGTTSETLAAVARFRELGGAGVITVTNYPDSPLADAADLVLAAPAGQEESIAQTRSFSSMLLLVQAFVADIAEQDSKLLNVLPGLVASLLNEAAEPMRALAHDPRIDRFFFLGSDPLFGVASEAMLKLKEMSLTNSEAFHTLEFRHGPISMVDQNAALLGLISPNRQAAEMAVVSDAAGFGAATLTLGAGGDLSIGPDVASWVRPVLYLPPLQILALERARSKGLNPDLPRNLVAVIELDNLGAAAE